MGQCQRWVANCILTQVADLAGACSRFPDRRGCLSASRFAGASATRGISTLSSPRTDPKRPAAIAGRRRGRRASGIRPTRQRALTAIKAATVPSSVPSIHHTAASTTLEPGGSASEAEAEMGGSKDMGRAPIVGAASRSIGQDLSRLVVPARRAVFRSEGDEGFDGLSPNGGAQKSG